VTRPHVYTSSLRRHLHIVSDVFSFSACLLLYSTVTMQGSDGTTRTFSATLVGAERSKDLAVLKVNAPPEYVWPVNIGRSSDVRVGQAVFAIGNPFGFDHTLTTVGGGDPVRPEQ